MKMKRWKCRRKSLNWRVHWWVFNVQNIRIIQISVPGTLQPGSPGSLYLSRQSSMLARSVWCLCSVHKRTVQPQETWNWFPEVPGLVWLHSGVCMSSTVLQRVRSFSVRLREEVWGAGRWPRVSRGNVDRKMVAGTAAASTVGAACSPGAGTLPEGAGYRLNCPGRIHPACEPQDYRVGSPLSPLQGTTS